MTATRAFTKPSPAPRMRFRMPSGVLSARLVAALQKRLGRTIRLHAEVDPALVGGAVVRAGDFVVDGSLRGRIERLGNLMAGA